MTVSPVFPSRLCVSALKNLFSEQPVNLSADFIAHFNQRRPRAFETFAGNFLRRVNAQLAAAGDFARRVVEHVGRAFGESLRTATMLSHYGSVLAVE